MPAVARRSSSEGPSLRGSRSWLTRPWRRCHPSSTRCIAAWVVRRCRPSGCSSRVSSLPCTLGLPRQPASQKTCRGNLWMAQNKFFVSKPLSPPTVTRFLPGSAHSSISSAASYLVGSAYNLLRMARLLAAATGASSDSPTKRSRDQERNFLTPDLLISLLRNPL